MIKFITLGNVCAEFHPAIKNKNIRMKSMFMNIKSYIAVFLLLTISGARAQQPAEVVKAILNGLEFIFDAQTGGIRSLKHAATGVMLQTTADSAGFVDLAYPVEEYEPLRLAPRYSKNAQITKGNGTVTIHWDALGPSKSFVQIKGKVSATVVLKEEPDGKSVSISCKIDNNSSQAIPQVIFPDLSGILPFSGTESTELRTGGAVIKPFVDMAEDEHEYFFAMNKTAKWLPYGFVLDGKSPVIPWLDIGGRNGGLSIFSKKWGINKGSDEGIYLKLSERTGKLRYMNILYENIGPDTSWQSGEFIFTPHPDGWAKGIIPYRQWAKQNIKRLYPVPDHIRDGLGFRTLWMRNFFYPEDPGGNNFTFKDLPRVARESKENGLNEMVLWGWNDAFKLPLLPVNKFLGTEQDLVNAVAECKKIGVNVAPFRSVMIAGPSTVQKYGVKPNTEYNYDPEFIPTLNPRFAVAQKGAAIIPSSNKIWQQEVLASTKEVINMGIPSISWDQFFNVGQGRHLDTVITEIIRAAKQKDPQATFSGEAGTNMENECDYLDYTWNWDYDDNWDHRALISSLHGIRINVNIDRSVKEAKIGFADNMFLNVYPRKPDGVNGSDYISNHPELSRALKQCARLRKQFLNYFVNGTFIADCILSKDCPDAHVSAYTLPGSMMVIVINKGAGKQISFEGNIGPWLESKTGRYKIKEYPDGRLLKTNTSGVQWIQKTPEMKNLDICIYEVAPE